MEIQETPVLTKREKLIVSGLYLSRFDSKALETLGFEGFTEAFNVIGYSLGARPASIKNYRDEFDPFFPNPRLGWHKRPLRDYCREVYETYGGLSFEALTELVKSFFREDHEEDLESFEDEESTLGNAFAQRLITGQAAERYFKSVYSNIPDFQGRLIEDTTQLGCGYDFRLEIEANRKDFLAVEVKGIKDLTGAISMTRKEFNVARFLRDRFFLFVAKNFRETPCHSLFRDPISCGLEFKRVEKRTIEISWSTKV